jgi:tetratricopeptide (TPR) repeat protein
MRLDQKSGLSVVRELRLSSGEPERLTIPQRLNATKLAANLAMMSLLHEQGRYREALAPGRLALAQARDAFGAKHYHTALALNGLGDLLDHCGDYAAARECAERALDIYEGLLGPGHPDTGTALSILAKVLRYDASEWTNVRTHSERSLQIYRAVFGDRDEDTILALEQYGFAVFRTGAGYNQKSWTGG